MKNVLILFLLMLLTACSESKAKFKVFNNSNVLIDSINISSSGTNYLEKSRILNLKPNEFKDFHLDMNNVEKSDGNYKIKVYSNNLKRKYFFGYYSNGVPSNSVYSIYVEKDTINVKENFK